MGLNIVVAGANGLTGSALVPLLVKDPMIASVSLLLRRPTSLTSPKIKVFQTDFQDTVSKVAFFEGADIFCCCLGTTIGKAGSQEKFRDVDQRLVIRLAKEAKAAGVKKMALVSSLGANASASNFYLKVKGETEEELKQIGFEELIILRPSMLLGARTEFRLGERIGKAIMVALGFLFLGKLRRYKAIQASAVATAMLRQVLRSNQPVIVLESEQIRQVAG